jgi:hypothetical protein
VDMPPKPTEIASEEQRARSKARRRSVAPSIDTGRIIVEGPVGPWGHPYARSAPRSAPEKPARFKLYVTHSNSTKGEIEWLDGEILNWLEDHRSRGTKVSKRALKKRDELSFRVGPLWNRYEVRFPANVWPYLHKARAFFEGDGSIKPVYTNDAPTSEAAVTPGAAPGMRDDFNTQVKQAKAENLARATRPSTHQLATYRALLQHVDLLNPDLAEDERKLRARRLVKAYKRVRERQPKFHDHNRQLRAAFSIVNSDQYQRTGKPKREAAKKLALG